MFNVFEPPKIFGPPNGFGQGGFGVSTMLLGFSLDGGRQWWSFDPSIKLAAALDAFALQLRSERSRVFPLFQAIRSPS